MRRLSVLLAATGWLVVPSGPAFAQLAGIPYGPTPTGTGFSLSADYGDPDPGSAWGLTGGLGLGKFGLLAGIGTWDGSGDDVTTFGAAGGLNVLNLGSVGVGAQFGVSIYDPGGGTRTDFLPGVHGRADILGFPVKPWAVIYDAIRDGGDDEFRFTIGADLNVLPTLGVHAGYDWGDNSDTWGIGAHFKFSAPVI